MCFFSWTERSLDSKLDGKYRVTCRSEIANIILIRNPRLWPQQPCWKSILKFFLNQKTNWLEISLEVLRWLVAQKYLKSFWLEISLWLDIQDGHHLENLYWTSFEQKCQLTFLAIRRVIQGHPALLVRSLPPPSPLHPHLRGQGHTDLVQSLLVSAPTSMLS